MIGNAVTWKTLRIDLQRVHGRLKAKQIRRKSSLIKNAWGLLALVFAFFLAGSLHEQGIAQKWGTALAATLLTFGTVVYGCRERLRYLSFWTSVSFLLTIHLVAMWGIFRYLLASFERSSILLWLPFMLIEVFVLLIAVKRVEELIRGERFTVHLRF